MLDSTFAPFELVRPCAPGALEWNIQLMSYLEARHPGVGGTVEMALHLTESAEAFYRGLFPLFSPSFPWGPVRTLPWLSGYAAETNDGSGGHRLISREICHKAETFFALSRSGDIDGNTLCATFELGLPIDGAKSTTQWLAVEALHAVDRFLTECAMGRPTASMAWLAAAHRAIMECTCKAYELLERAK